MCLQLVFVIIVKACHFVIFFFQKSLIVFIIHKKVLIFFLAFFLYKNSHLFQIFCLKTIKLEPCFTYYMV